MFGFKNKNKKVEFKAMASGVLIPITKVADDVFSQKMMGDGFAIQPNKGEILAPISGEIKMVADTKHAIMLVTDTGLEILLHLGIDTVELQGAPFKIHVSVGDQVSVGDKLADMDLDFIREHEKKTTAITVITNMDKVSTVDVKKVENVTPADVVADVTLS
ncbi:PTS glucose transporter subunit IIA [Ligilactobacillus sp. WILCCON 0076]|uniref:PTS glucose transporter subunit IIA n=1 Tax=Ligilactobacillus ubinensis TaxID=2876789 RepID=A0A9X2FMC9_9LACO|nr:PTS glucose transporter subunit IIA [Ligilactobacillus ubinensis]MCP0887093.1 PTS glucose transporter subunit IIA [Ligilactobacillus ubinensis]